MACLPESIERERRSREPHLPWRKGAMRQARGPGDLLL